MSPAKKGTKGAKGTAGEKPSRRRSARRPVDRSARTIGASAGLLVALWACWQLLGRQVDLTTAGRMAVLALVVSYAVERLVVPAGRALMGRPQQD